MYAINLELDQDPLNAAGGGGATSASSNQQQQQQQQQQFNQYQAADLLLEVDFKEPILQIAAGTLLANSAKIQLAVLHPRRFAVYSISSTSGAVDQGTAYNVLLIYEHVFEKEQLKQTTSSSSSSFSSSAVSCLLGTFGQQQQQQQSSNSSGGAGTLQREAVCIQHSGSLHFYENEAFSFAFQRGSGGGGGDQQTGSTSSSSSKNRTAFPGELAHIAAHRGQPGDLIVMTGDDGFYSVECYRYQELAMANLAISGGVASSSGHSASFAKMGGFTSTTSRDSHFEDSHLQLISRSNSQSTSNAATAITINTRPPTNYSSSSSSSSEGSRGSSGVIPEWVYAFGETVLAMQTVCLETGAGNSGGPGGGSGSSQSWYIVLLGERNLAVLRENGSLWFVKKFDVSPSALCAYAANAASSSISGGGGGEQSSLVSIVGTHMCNLLIYQNDALRWASKVAFVPVAISRAHFAAISGALVLLSDEGSLAVGYLGTNPSLKVIPMPSSSGAFGNGTGEESSASSSSSSEKMAEDLKELKKIVAAYHLEGNGSNGGKSAESEANNRISLYLDLLLTGLEQPPADTSSSLLLAVNLELSSMAPLATGPLTVHFLPGDFYEISPAEPITVPSLEKGKPEPIRLLLKSRVPLPLSPKLKAAVLLHNEEGAVRVLRKTVRLPLEGLVQVHGGGKGGKGGHGKGSGAPSRRFSVKVIFEGRSLEEVRSAVFGPAGRGGLLAGNSESSEALLVGGGSSSAPPQSEVSLHYRSNPSMEATIRVAAAAGGDEGRGGGGGGVALQVEGNQVAALYRTLRELRRRVLRSSPAVAPPLTSSPSSSTSTPTQSPTPVGSPPPPPPQLATSSSLSSSSAVTVHSLLATLQPVDALAAKIEQRLVLRKALAACQSALDRFSTHYRVLQKRILVKLKDRQPSSLAHFEKLLKTVHAKVRQRGDFFFV